MSPGWCCTARPRRVGPTRAPTSISSSSPDRAGVTTSGTSGPRSLPTCSKLTSPGLTTSPGRAATGSRPGDLNLLGIDLTIDDGHVEPHDTFSTGQPSVIAGDLVLPDQTAHSAHHTTTDIAMETWIWFLGIHNQLQQRRDWDAYCQLIQLLDARLRPLLDDVELAALTPATATAPAILTALQASVRAHLHTSPPDDVDVTSALAGAIRDHVPWSAVWRIPTRRGGVLVKQPTAVRAREGAAQAFCAAVAPEHVDRPLAFDPATGRILLLDRGPTMYQAAPGTRGVDLVPMSAMVTGYARLQQATIRSGDGAAAAGIVRWDPADAPADAERQARLLHDLPTADPRHLSGSQHATGS